MNATDWDKGKIEALSIAAQKVHELQLQIPLNSAGEPTAYIDVTRLLGLGHSAVSLSILSIHDEDVKQATRPIAYLEGFPSTVLGTPFWERLEDELPAYFDLFRAYRDETYLKGLLDPTLKFTKTKTARSIYKIADRTETDRKVIIALSQMYHWHQRVRAYDKYQKEQLEQFRQAEIKFMQNTHAQAAEKIFDRTLSFFEQHIDDLNPKIALEWFQMATELQRLSLGLYKDKPEDPELNQQAKQGWGQTHISIHNQQNPNQQNQHNQQNPTIEERANRLTAILNTLQDADALPTKGGALDAAADDGEADH